jgi:hypothetical protein
MKRIAFPQGLQGKIARNSCLSFYVSAMGEQKRGAVRPILSSLYAGV